MSNKSIAFGGGIKMGKSTATEFLVKNHGYYEVAFAKTLKDLVKLLFNLDDKYLYDQEFKEQIIPELNVSARQLLQVIGTELFRNDLMRHLPQLRLIGGSMWIHSAAKKIEALRATGIDKIVVSDKRFDNEYDFLHENGFKVYDISREAMRPTDGPRHASEMGSRYDELITNDGTIDEFYDAIEEIVFHPDPEEK